MHDILFTTIERLHAPLPFGRVLDSGTGVNSLKWIQSLNSTCTAWTAITADAQMRATILADPAVAAGIRGCDRLLVGNWMNDQFCESLGEYDTILADYLIGAVDGFSPFAQDLIIKRLKRHLSPNGRLYLVGMQPIPDHAAGPAEVITEVRRARDACILLAGHRPYREYPVDWITRHMEMEGLRIIKTKSFNILHTVESASRQIRVAQTKLDLMPSSTLRAGMSAYLEELTERVRVAVASNGGKIPLSFDYIVAAELPPAENLGATIFSLLAAPFAGGGAGADGAGGDAAAAAAAAAGAGAEAGEVGIANPPTPLGHGHDH